MPAPARVISYVGPACPRCNVPLALENITPGEDICPRCQGFFTATVFHPPQRVARVLQLAEGGVETASSCANHPRNAAVSSCDRCGVFICSLCELDLHGEKFCPSCFDRMTRGTIDSPAITRFRNWYMLAMVSAFVGLFMTAAMVGIPLGGLALYYVVRGFRDPQMTRDRYPGLLFAALLALAAMLSSAWFFSAYFLKP